MDKALFVIDMLNDFIDPDGALYCGETARDIVWPVGSRVREYRAAGLPIIFLADAHDKDDLEFAKFPKHCVAGTWGAQLINGLTPTRAERLIHKTRYDGFYNTNLNGDMALAGLRPQLSTIEVCGVCTSICVMDTVGQLANRDFATVVHRNCVADFDPEMHEMSLKRMSTLYGATII